LYSRSYPGAFCLFSSRCSEAADEVKTTEHTSTVHISAHTTTEGATGEIKPPKHSDASLKCDKQHIQLPYTGPAYPAGYIRVTSSTSENLPTAQDAVREMLRRYSAENPECPVAVRGKESGGGKKKGRGKQSRVIDESASSGERYEKSLARHGDAAFMKFQKELGKCPQQLLRYV